MDEDTKKAMDDKARRQDMIRQQILTQLTVSIEVAGEALGLCRNASFAAAKRGDIPTIPLGHRRPVPTAPIRRMLHLETE